MNKLFTKIATAFVGMAMAIGVGVGVANNREKVNSAYATETSAYKMSTVQSSSNTAYATYYDNITIGTKTWKAPGNQNFSGYWRIGGKKDNNNTDISRYLQCKTSFDENITKVTLSHNGFSRSGISISGATLTIASDASFTENIQTSNITPTVAQTTASSFSFENASGWGTNMYYKIDLTMASTSTSNGGLDIKSIEFFYDDGSAACEHTYGDWVVTTAATCTEAGSHKKTCSKCGDEIVEAIAALGHDYVAGTVHAPTCTEAGYTEYECSRCHDEKHDDEVAALGHNYVNGTCTRCGAEEPDETIVTFTPGTDTGETSVTKNGVTATMTTMNNSEYYQIYGNASGTFTSDENILKIEFTCTASGTNKYGPGNTSCDVGNYSYSGTVGTWTGSAKSITLSSTAQVRMSSLEVTREGGDVVEYTIAYHANANDEETGSMSSTVGTNPVVQECGYEWEGHTFVAWNTQADGEGTDYAVGTTVTEDLDLYAVWQEYIAPIGADVTMTGGGDAYYSVSVNDKDAIRAGAGSKSGSVTLTLTKANISKIKVYIAGWDGDSTTVSVSTSATISNEHLSNGTLTITRDSGISGNSNSFTLDGNESTYKFIFTLSNAPANTTITFTSASASKSRFVVWGATNLLAETFAQEFISNTACNVNGTSEPTFNNDSSWLKLEASYNGLDSEEQGLLHDATYTKSGSGAQTIVEATGTTNQTIAEAMAKYDYIEGRYNPNNLGSSPWKNFIGRSITPIGQSNSKILVDAISNDSNVSMIVIVISLVSITALGGFFFLRKRKEEK